MDELNISQLERFKKLGRLFDVDKIITPEEMTQILESIIGILAEFKKETVSLNEESKSVVRHSLDDIQHALDLSISKLESKADDGTSSIKTEYTKAEKILGQLVQSYKNAEVLYDNLVNFKAADGRDGRPGTDGDNGYTPIKGKDYFTEQEKKELVEEISSNIQLDDSKTLREEIEAIKASVKSQTVMVGGRGIADAPRDGKVYGRQNRSWVEVVGGGADATTADIADSTNKRYVTDAQLTVLGNTSGTNTGDQTSIAGITGTTAQFNTALTDGDFATLAGTETLTNKRITKRSQTITSTATLTPSWDTDDNIFITAQAAAITIANPTGTPTQGQTIMIRIKDNGTARAITYGTNYRAFVAALPTTTTISKTLYLGLVANTTDTKVDTTAMSEV